VTVTLALRFGLLGCVAVLAACGSSEPEAETGAPPPAENMMVRPHNQSSEVQTADGVTIHFDHRGQGDVTVVLVHGWGCDSGYWQRQREWLSRRHRVVSIDLAGHGKSTSNRTDWSMAAFGEDVAAVAAELDLDNMVLVGHSMGGPVVLEAARLLEGKVIGVVGADTLWNVGQPFPSEQRQAYIQNLQEDFTAAVTAIVEAMFVEGSDPAIRNFIINDMASTPPEVGIPSLIALSDYDEEGGLERLTVPMVLINSDYRPNHIAPLAQRVDDFQFVEMTGVGHFVMLDDPSTFNGHLEQAIQDFAVD